MPDNVSFEGIPVDIRTPGQYIEIDNTKAVQGLPNQERKILVLVQRLAAGSVAEGIPTRVLNVSQAEDFFGRGSIGHIMLRALKAANNTTDVWAVALDDNGAGVAATGSVLFGGAVTAAGTLNAYIAGQQVQVAVASGEAGSVTATNFAAAINSASDLPVTAAVNGVTAEQVDFTARNKGEVGNDVDIRFNYYQGEVLPKGLTATVTAMNGGSGNPDVATALAAVSDDQYYTIVNPWSDSANIVKLEAEMDARWGPLQQRTGHVFTAYKNTHANLSTYGNGRNSVHTTTFGLYDVPTLPCAWAAAEAGIVEFNGAIDPARPFQTLKIPGVMAPPEQSRFNRAERDVLLHDGISTYTVGADGSVYIERVITNYQKNAFGIEDISYLDLNTKWTVDYIRYALRTRIGLRFPRYKLADDGTRFAPGQAIVTPNVVRAECVALFTELEEVGLVENFAQFKQDLLVVRSVSDPNRVNCVFPPDIINQFRIFAAAIQYRL